jgi:hypothetical protein
MPIESPFFTNYLKKITMENWKRNILEFLHKEELILYIGWNKLLEEWVEEWGDFMGQIKLGNIQINNNGKDIEISLSNDIEQTISLYYFLKFDEQTALYDQILWIEYTMFMTMMSMYLRTGLVRMDIFLNGNKMLSQS